MIDTHTHLYSEEFDQDRQEAVSRAFTNGVSRIFLPAIDSETHQKMLDLEAAYPQKIFAMMGLHPCSVKPDTWEKELEIVEKYLNQRDFCAVGEIGIDLYWEQSTLDIQIKAFEKQIDWAVERDLPIVIHTRNSFDETFEVLERKKYPRLRGIFHCFSGDLAQALRAIEMGFYLGIGGVVTFKNGKIDQFLGEIPLEKIVLETDCPYLTPVPFRGKRNEPIYTKYVAEEIARIKEISVEEVIKVTTENAKRIYVMK